MGKGSPQAQPTTTTVNQNKLPDYAQPYLEQALQQGQALSQTSYTPYGGEQLAPLSSQQYQAMDAAGNLPQASAGAFSGAQNALNGVANYNPMQVNSSYQAGNFAPQSWLNQNQPAWMDPYQQAVTDSTIRQIRMQGDLNNAQINDNAVKAGAFGGDRQAVARSLNNYYTQQNVGQAQAQGAEQAYQSGLGQFNTQNQLGLSAFQQNQAAQQAAGQQGLAAQQANQSAWGQAQGLRLNAGQGLTSLGQQQGETALKNQAALQNSGAIMQAQQQSADNIAYQNFLNQLNFPYQQVGFMGSLVNGLPLGTIGTTASYQNPNTVSQMLGLGLGGLGLSQALGKA